MCTTNNVATATQTGCDTTVSVNPNLVNLTGLVLEAHSAVEQYMFDKAGICNYPYDGEAFCLDESLTDVTSTLINCIGKEVVDEIRKRKSTDQ